MPPILFALFIEDMELYIQSNDSSGLTFHDISLILLLFADDMVIFGHNQMDLQNSLDMLSEYCTRWGYLGEHRQDKSDNVKEKRQTYLDPILIYISL